MPKAICFTKTDALGHVTTYTYDVLRNEILSMADPNGQITTYANDGHGNRPVKPTLLLGGKSRGHDSHGIYPCSPIRQQRANHLCLRCPRESIEARTDARDITKDTDDMMGDVTSVTDANIIRPSISKTRNIGYLCKRFPLR